MAGSKDKPASAATDTPAEKPKCGIVMPISPLDDCSTEHWLEVKRIITEAVETVGFTANLVSDADEVGIIQKRIIQNLYDNPVVVCDVSGKNPNVMFELGIRLAFDKPTIIIKDDRTSYSFDTSPIEHLEYPRDLRFYKIVDFKAALAEKVKATAERAAADPGYSAFLKSFGSFTVARIETKEVSKEDFIIEELRELRTLLARNRLPGSLASGNSREEPAGIEILPRIVERLASHSEVRSGDQLRSLALQEMFEYYMMSFGRKPSISERARLREVLDEEIIRLTTLTQGSDGFSGS